MSFPLSSKIIVTRSSSGAFVASASNEGRCLRIRGVPPKFETDQEIQHEQKWVTDRLRDWIKWSGL